MADDDQQRTWLTEDAHARLTAELEQLREVARPEASAAIERAREHGDIRENAEYDAAKEEQGRIEARIRQLEQLLAKAVVGEAPEGDEVAAGTVVTVEDDAGEQREFLLGSREDRPEGLRVVSADSPLGRALIGSRVGDEAAYDAPAGERRVRVVAVRPHEG